MDLYQSLMAVGNFLPETNGHKQDIFNKSKTYFILVNNKSKTYGYIQKKTHLLFTKKKHILCRSHYLFLPKRPIHYWPKQKRKRNSFTDHIKYHYTCTELTIIKLALESPLYEVFRSPPHNSFLILRKNKNIILV